MRKFVDLTGQKFTRLKVLFCAGKNKRGKSLWNCKCDCGIETVAVGGNLKNEHIKSCGCLAIEKTIQRNKANAGLNKNCWTQKEIEFLKVNYLLYGPQFCKDNLNRTKSSVLSKAMELNLKTIVARSTGLPKKIIIKKISNSKVLSLCQIHGETIHYCRNNKIAYCVLCKNISAKNKRLNNLDHYKKYFREYTRNKRKNDLVYNLTNRLRTLIGNALREISKDNNRKTKGCFRNLDYTPKQLYNYLNNIKKLQNNECPICKINYSKCTLSIDHVIPLERAKTEQEIIDLFCLQNLNLMCKSCNSSKNDKDYKIWMKTKVSVTSDKGDSYVR